MNFCSQLFASVLLACVLSGCAGGDEVSGREGTSSEIIELGEVIYQQHCAGCHGAEGEGQAGWQSPRRDGTYPAPPHDSSGHTWHHPDDVLLDIIRRGGEAAYGRPGFTSGMPGFGDQLTEAEIWAVLAYLKTLWGEEERAFQEALSTR